VSVRIPTLAERIEALRNDICAFIDAKVEAERVTCPGIPAGALRNMLVRGVCDCVAFLQLTEKAS
jgi:hypothetical protein